MTEAPLPAASVLRRAAAACPELAGKETPTVADWAGFGDAVGDGVGVGDALGSVMRGATEDELHEASATISKNGGTR